MIVPMKRVTLVCLAAAREQALTALRELGLIHLTPARPPAGPALEEAHRALEQAEAALGVLDAHRAAHRAAQTGAAHAQDPAALAACLRELAARRKALSDRLAPLAAEEKAAARFGDFDPSLIPALAGRGVAVRLYATPPAGMPSVPAGVLCIPIRGEGHAKFFAAVSRRPFQLDASEVQPPPRRLSDVRAERERIAAERTAVEREIGALVPQRAALKTLTGERRERVRLEEARAGMGQAPASLEYLQGFCPAPRVAELRAAARRHGWGLLVTDPTTGAPVPTLIRLPRWAQPISSLFDLIKIVPGYREVDVGASFLLFLSVFYAMIVADAGYGLVFLLLTLGARLMFRSAPREPFTLMYVFNLCTIAWGVLTGTYFGLSNHALPFPAAQHLCAWLNDSRHMMLLCLALGSSHLTLAHAWNAFRCINTPQSLAQAGWIALTWTLFVAGKTMLLGAAFPVWAGWLGGAGLLLVVLFMTPPAKLKAEWINHAMLPMSLMSVFGDILSYLRLFALGVAGLQLANAFNTIGGNIGTGSPLHAFGAALVLLLGHGLNITLSLMSVLVHGIRLNALEFSMHLGMEWSGFAFRPFARDRAGSH
jgi:V/A-type H+-transporting ATPase subunit I